jgi:predicted nucleotidyltransferase component of viral defense system
VPKNVAASVHQRLLNQARETGRPFDELLQYFAMERFLYRLSQSRYRESFVLKGALLFRIWAVPDTRATRDMDFLAFVDNSLEHLTEIIQSTAALQVPDDGLLFDSESVEAERIKEDADYEGVRIRFRAFLGSARVTMQIDVGFGDVVHPDVVVTEYPTLLDFPLPTLRSYPPETVIAEKVEAMLNLGELNSRMKDFFDVWRLSHLQNFDARILCDAIRATLENRKTDVVAYSELRHELLASDEKQAQWTAFLKNSGVDGPDSFANLLDALGLFLSPMLDAIGNRETIEGTWPASGPWNLTSD